MCYRLEAVTPTQSPRDNGRVLRIFCIELHHGLNSCAARFDGTWRLIGDSFRVLHNL